ncbi:hypothetical protein EVAR_8290_1 [Eumeta japonica]|uniref:FCP1 homology domain-containing protein n=1 Tax=Eumeta variegata TaxID=151549 RepID=A0A4C1Y9R7_EUMVA|nr:hypothetical protein EVAR_8290_1 [Eumeta japonica]
MTTENRIFVHICSNIKAVVTKVPLNSVNINHSAGSIVAGTLQNSRNGRRSMRDLRLKVLIPHRYVAFLLAQHQSVKYEIYPLSPVSRHRLSLVKRKLLVLDLDETLIHSHHDAMLRPTVKPSTPPDFVLKVTIDKHPVRFFVHKRPHVDYFLDIVSQWYELVVFTASMEIYGAAVADKLDNGRGILRRRFYSFSMSARAPGTYTHRRRVCVPPTKDLCNYDAERGSNWIVAPDNAIPIKSWFSDPLDVALLNLLPVLDALRFTHDVRSVLSRNLHLHRLW